MKILNLCKKEQVHLQYDFMAVIQQYNLPKIKRLIKFTIIKYIYSFNKRYTIY